MLSVCRVIINTDYNEDIYDVLKTKQNRAVKNKGTPRKPHISPTGSTLVVLRWWTVDPLNCSHEKQHNNLARSYKIEMMTTGCIITITRRHVKAAPTTAEEYLRDQSSNNAKPDILDDIC